MEPTPPEAPTTSSEPACLRLSEGNAEAVEEQLPGRNGGKRQGGGFGKGKRVGLVSGEALIDEMELTVGAGTERVPA